MQGTVCKGQEKEERKDKIGEEKEDMKRRGICVEGRRKEEEEEDGGRGICLWDINSWVLLSDKVDISPGQILADYQPSVVALGIVPGESVSEEVV